MRPESRPNRFFHKEGIRYSPVPRDRGTERAARTIGDGTEKLLDEMFEGGAKTAFYVVLANREGATPDAGWVNPRTIFEGQGVLVDNKKLSDEPDAAEVQVIGSVTGPYAAGEGEYHWLYLVSKDGPVPTFGDLEPAEMETMHSMIGSTLDFTHEQYADTGARSYVGFSFSPLESRRVQRVIDPSTGQEMDVLFPRDPVQNIASIHAHIVVTKPENWVAEPESDKKYNEALTREPLLDRLTAIFRSGIYEKVLEEFPDLPHEYFEHTEDDDAFPKGILMTFDRKHLDNPRFSEFIQALHKKAEELYYQIADTVADKDKMAEGLVVMRDPEEQKARIKGLLNEEPFKDMPHEAQQLIKMLAKMKDPGSMTSPEMSHAERARVSSTFLLLGMAYNIVYYTPENDPGKVVVAMHPRWMTSASPTETLGVFKDQTEVPSEDFEPVRQAHLTAAGQLNAHLGATVFNKGE